MNDQSQFSFLASSGSGFFDVELEILVLHIPVVVAEGDGVYEQEGGIVPGGGGVVFLLKGLNSLEDVVSSRFKIQLGYKC